MIMMPSVRSTLSALSMKNCNVWIIVMLLQDINLKWDSFHRVLWIVLICWNLIITAVISWFYVTNRCFGFSLICSSWNCVRCYVLVFVQKRRTGLTVLINFFFFFLMWLSVFYCLNMMGGDFTVRPVEQERKIVQ